MSDLKKRILLLVEDEAIIALSQKATLEKYEYKVLTANSGENAIEKFGQNPDIDLILMDIDLGEGIDGTETARRILNVRTIPIVFLSSHTEPQVVEKTEQITSYGYVVKNSGITVLDASIKMAFKLFKAHIKAEIELGELKKAEEKLIRINEIFNLSQESSGLGTWDWDIQTGIIEWTENLFKIFGIDSPHYTASFETWRSILHPDDLAEAEANIEKALKEHLDLYNEYRIILNDGEERWIYARGKGIYDEYGQPQRMIGACIDITGRKRAEESLKNSESKYRHLFEAESDAIFLIYEETGRIFEANAAAFNTYGYSYEELLTKSNRDMSAEPDLTSKAMKDHESFIPIRWHRKKDGTVFPVEISTSHMIFNNRSVHIAAIRDITERIQMENVLLKNEALFRGIIENVPIGMFQSTPEGKFIYVNPALSNMLGYNTPEELIQTVNQTSIADALYENPELRPQLVQQVEQSNNNFKVFENRYRRKDGQVVDTILSFCEIEDPVTGLMFLNGFVQDITDRKKAEDEKNEIYAELISIGEKYRVLFENAAEGIFIARDNFINFVNPALEVILGYPGEVLVSQPFASFIHPEDRTLVFERHKRRMAGENVSIVYEFRIITRDGEEKWVETHSKRINWNGDINNLTFVTDITERKLAEEALHESNERFRLVFENAPLGLLHFDDKGKIIICNDQFVRIIGSSYEKLIGLDMTKLPDKNIVSAVKSALSGIPGKYEDLYHSATADKSTYVQVLFEPIPGADGAFNGGVGIIENITDRKKSEKNIENLLHEKELILHEVHHRIKNNMNTILGLLTLQADAQENPDIKSVLFDAAGRMQGMRVLYDKLYCSENESELSLKEYLPALINEIVSIFPSKEKVKIDTQIDEIILNSKILSPVGIIINELLTNTMKYAFKKTGSGMISVTATKKDNVVTIIYGDNGLGIPEYITLENSAGFGMRLIGMLMVQLGGSVVIERGNGTRFILVIEV
jgi:PAS domain S-box-containing protein